MGIFAGLGCDGTGFILLESGAKTDRCIQVQGRTCLVQSATEVGVSVGNIFSFLLVDVYSATIGYGLWLDCWGFASYVDDGGRM